MDKTSAAARSLLAFALALGAGSAAAAPRQVTLIVPTMDCATCPITIRAALLKVPGVSKAQVSYQKRRAVVSYDDARVSVTELTRATDEAGYPSFVSDPQ
jgi:mercuric ion binding protein